MGGSTIASGVRPLVIYATGDAAIAGTCWGDLRCIDVEISLLDGHVTVTVEEASPSTSKLCRFVAKELARRGHDEIAVRTEW